MQLQTASQVINFAVELEDKSAKFYEDLTKKYEEGRETFLSFVKENKKNKLWTQRAYNEVVSDALETGFSFEGFCIDDYLIEVNLHQGGDILKETLAIEDKIQRFYLDVAERSKSFLADIPREFERIGKKREERKRKIKSIFERGGI